MDFCLTEDASPLDSTNKIEKNVLDAADGDDETTTIVNTVQFQNVKMEHESEAAATAEDPLCPLSQVDVKYEVVDEFIGQYNEKDLLNEIPDDEDSPLCDVREMQRSKRMRNNSATMIGRSGYIWTNVKPLLTTMLDCIVNSSLQPKGKGPAKDVCNMLDAWHLLLDEPILQSIVKYTNEEIKRLKRKELSFQQTTDIAEFRAWLGLHYLCGIFRYAPNANTDGDDGNDDDDDERDNTLEELWTPELGNGIFRATMSFRRFKFLSDVLLFPGQMTSGRRTIKTSSDLKAVNEIWEKFIINCRSYYAPSNNCSMHENIIDMTGTTCPSQLSLPHVPDKCGIRLISLHDAKTLYMCNAIISDTTKSTKDEVLYLVCDIKGTNRNVTLSNRYTSLEMANQLLEYQLTLVGAMDPSANEIPSEFVKSRNKKRRLYSGAISLLPQESHTDLLLASGIADKINPIKLYDVTQRTGQRFHQGATTFSACKSVSASCAERWPLRFLHTMLNYACMNAWILYRLSEKGNVKMQQRDFQRQLGLLLTQQQLKRRIHANVRLPLQSRLLASEILGEPLENLLSAAVSETASANCPGIIPSEKLKLPDGIRLLPRTTVKRTRCRKCPTRSHSKSRFQCQQCGRSMCLSHLTMRCEDCTGITTTSQNNEKSKDEQI